MTTPLTAAPATLAAHTRTIAELAESKGFVLRWDTGRACRLLHLAAHGPHGAYGHVVVGPRSGKALRAMLAFPSDYGIAQLKAEGATAVHALLVKVSPSPCPPGCTAPGVTACFHNALQ